MGPKGLGAGSAWPLLFQPVLAAQYESVTGRCATPYSMSVVGSFGTPS